MIFNNSILLYLNGIDDTMMKTTSLSYSYVYSDERTENQRSKKERNMLKNRLNSFCLSFSLSTKITNENFSKERINNQSPRRFECAHKRCVYEMSKSTWLKTPRYFFFYCNVVRLLCCGPRTHSE